MIDVHFRRIDAPHIAEILGERFDNYMELMTPGAIVYGGAIRDVLAGLPLKGDLDIAVCKADYNKVCSNFRDSVKWMDQLIGGFDDDEPIPAKGGLVVPHGNRKTYKEYELKRRIRNPYEGVPMEAMTTFVMGDIQAQVICSDSSHPDPFEAALHVARNVDLICCGVVMDHSGNIFEVVEGALQDCENKVLRINSLETIKIDKTKARIDRLVERGWDHKINMNAITTKVRRLEAKRKRIEQARAEKARKAASAKKEILKINKIKEGLFLLSIPPRVMMLKHLPPKELIHSISRKEAENMSHEVKASITIHVSKDDSGGLKIHCSNRGLIVRVANILGIGDFLMETESYGDKPEPVKAPKPVKANVQKAFYDGVLEEYSLGNIDMATMEKAFAAQMVEDNRMKKPSKITEVKAEAKTAIKTKKVRI